jgi:hypothetical protein
MAAFCHFFRFDRGAPCGQEKGQLTGSASACLVDENKAEKKNGKTASVGLGSWARG